ncbi:unnamed protein product [Rotaria magnacalcarata]|uniref:Uncharacterized protein n=1 Tax=Rotaria magnacalcarata TaxID=392030 RepID=A0A8S3BSJ1_9BILA|nr:unnamed protein product [Rotaria magnacalcarata]
MTSNDSEQDGWYTTSCGNCIFTLPTRYQNLVHIGYGTYGAVGRATDTVCTYHDYDELEFQNTKQKH